jgi:hypothetical protein
MKDFTERLDFITTKIQKDVPEEIAQGMTLEEWKLYIIVQIIINRLGWEQEEMDSIAEYIHNVYVRD